MKDPVCFDLESPSQDDSLKAQGLLRLYITSLRQRLELLAQEDVEAVFDLIYVCAAGEQDFSSSGIVEHGSQQVLEEQETWLAWQQRKRLFPLPAVALPCGGARPPRTPSPKGPQSYLIRRGHCACSSHPIMSRL